MFKRIINNELNKWVLQRDRKPLVIRGARQVGKTTLVNEFAGQFDQYLYFNLELKEDRAPFENFTNTETLVQMSEGINPKEYMEIAINGTKNGVLKEEIDPSVAEDAAYLGCQTFQPSPDFLFKVKTSLKFSFYYSFIDVLSYSR